MNEFPQISDGKGGLDFDTPLFSGLPGRSRQCHVFPCNNGFRKEVKGYGIGKCE